MTEASKEAQLAAVETLAAEVSEMLEGVKADHAGSVVIVDTRWLSIAQTHFQEAFMAIRRAIQRPEHF